MKKTLLFCLCVVAVTLSSTVSAAEVKSNMLNVDSLKIAATDSSTVTAASIKADVTAINSKVNTIDKKVQNAFKSLVSDMSTKEEAANFEKKIAQINSNTKLTAAEKSAKLTEILADYSVNLQNNKTKFITQLKNSSAAKKADVSNSLSALISAGSEYLDVVNDSKSLMLKLSTNPSLALSCASDLTSITTTAKTLKNNAKYLKNITSQVSSIAKAAGVKVSNK